MTKAEYEELQQWLSRWKTRPYGRDEFSVRNCSPSYYAGFMAAMDKVKSFLSGAYHLRGNKEA